MRALALTFVLLLAAVAPAQTLASKPAPAPKQNSGIVFWKMAPHSVEFLLNNIPQRDPIRLAQLKQTFTDLQCRGSNLREQSFAGGKNLLCILPGTPPVAKPGPVPGHAPETGTILFIAHYEHQGSGQSAVDNWSGAIMLSFLYHALSATPRQHTFLFAEVNGDPGAEALFNSFSLAQRHDMQAVIALDSLGLGPAQYYINPNDTSSSYEWFWIHDQLLNAAADLRLPQPVAAIPGGWFKTDVTRPFRYHGIPSIVIHSVNLNARDLPGSASDTAKAIDHNAYFNTIALLSVYAAEMDLKWPSPISGSSAPSNHHRH
ncbi:MAG: M28 family peptidase [Silvibacterium sp.]